MSGNPNGNLWAYPGIKWASGSWMPAIANTQSFGTATFGIPQNTPTQAACNKQLSQANHTGQVQVTLMDGSVRAVSQSISQTTWQNALTPADGNTLGPDW